MICRTVSIWMCPLLLTATLILMETTGHAQQTELTVPATALWSFEDAVAQLKLYPKDVYLQYVAMKLGQREGIDASGQLGIGPMSRRELAMERRENVDLFNIFSGALAIQESLQLDAMRPQSAFAATAEDRMREAMQGAMQKSSPRSETDRQGAGGTVRIRDLQGPIVKSHPWEEMLKGRKPELSPLASFVPSDQYYVRFGSVRTMLELVETGDLFATHLFSQAGAPAYKRNTEQQLKQQLAIETNPLARPFYDLVVKEIVLTGSDPFVIEGSDVTLLFRFDQEPVFRIQMEAYLKSAQSNFAGVVRSEGEWQGIPYVHLTTPDRRVHVFSAYPQKGLHVRSNSLPAFQKVLSLIQGRKKNGIESLGDTTEFAFIRTLMPTGAPEEDGLIYLSDPFIRRLVGPELKLTELRRLKCFNNLKMIGHAAAMFETEHGHRPKSLEGFANCLPDGFGENHLKCACGGEYSLSADGAHGVCSHHGHAERLVPCCEIPETEVSNSEAEAYRQFEQEYSQYWRTFFDPIAIRIKTAPEKYRVETIVLPLIDNSMYQSLASVLGGEPQPLDTVTIEESIMSLSFAVNKQRLLQMSGWERPAPVVADEGPPENVRATFGMTESTNNLRMIGLAMHNYHDVHNHFPAAVNCDARGKPLLSWRVHILPFLEAAALYNEFHLDEAWDSPHNKPLINRMPDAFRSPGAKSLKPGMTTYVTVVGDATVFPPDGKSTSFRDITDGTSNTGMVIEVAVENAVLWTKPDDIAIEPAALRKALADRFRNGGLVTFCDGSVRILNGDLDDATFRDLFVRDDGNVLPDVTEPAQRIAQFQSDPLGLGELTGGRISEHDAWELIADGLGSTVSLHVCDSDPMLDIQMTRLLSQFAGASGGFGRRSMDSEILFIALAVASINSPVYACISIEDAAIVDRFLAKLDEGMAFVARTPADLGWFQLEKDFYTIPKENLTARIFSVAVGPIKWRFFFTRIGNHVCISSKPHVLEQLAELDKARAGLPAAAPDEARSHAALQIHPSHWKQILPTIRMNWDEAARNSCLDNLGHLTSAARGMETGGDAASDAELSAAKQLVERAAEIYGVRHFCPAGGHYAIDGEGKCSCSVHGTALQPRQPTRDDQSGMAHQVLSSFDDVRVMLTFLEDGLHAVLEIERKADK